MKAYDVGFRVQPDGKVVLNGLIRRTRIDGRGYHTFNIPFSGQSYPVRVHNLAAYQKFGDAVFETETTRHLGNGSTDNSLDTIAIGSQKDNMGDRDPKACHEHALKAGRVRAKLNKDLVRELRRLHAAGLEGIQSMASRLGISKSTISYAVHGRTWQDVA